MRCLVPVLVLCVLPIAASDESKRLKAEEQSLRISSNPPGAHVVINGRDRGVTPLALTDYGPWAYEMTKRTLLSKHLSEALTLEIAKDGFKTERLVITRGPFTWTSFNHKQTYEYWLINSPEYAVTLRPGGRVLVNDDVIGMVKAGFSDDIVIDKIRTSDCAFKTELDDLVKLKGAGVSNDVISAMMHAGEGRQ